MSASEAERHVHGMMVRIDRTLCVGFGDCIREGDSAFVLDEEGIAVFAMPESLSREVLLESCEACPVDALTVVDSDGRTIVPS